MGQSDIARQDSNLLPQSNPFKSTLVSRNVTIAGHRTSVRLEPAMWSGFQEICRRERVSTHDVCTAIFTMKEENTSLTAAIRVYIMNYYRLAATEDGHQRAGHGQGLVGGHGVRPVMLAQAAHSAAAMQALKRMDGGAAEKPPAQRNGIDNRRW